MYLTKETVIEHELVIDPVIKVLSARVPLHPEALETIYPLSGEILNEAVWPSLTVADVGEIAPLSPAEAVIV